MRAAVSLLALLAASPALADEFTVQAPVAAVTVYPEGYGARLTHRASLDLPAGSHRVFIPWDGSGDVSSFPRIATSDGLTIQGLGFRHKMTTDREALFTPAQATAFAALEAARAEADKAADALASARAEVKALKARIAFLAAATPGDGASPDALVTLADALTTETRTSAADLVKARAALRPLEKAAKDAKSAQDAARTAFDKLSPPAATSDMLEVDLTAAKAGAATLEFTDRVYDAGWAMDYDLDLDRAAGKLTVDRNLALHQETGQSWADVALTVSVARPGETTAPTPSRPDKADIHPPYPQAEARVGSMAPALMAEPEAVVQQPSSKFPQLVVDGLALTYVYPQNVTIASGDVAELALDSLTLPATPAVRANPRRDDTAFTVATFTNTTSEPLIPGMANFLRDGHFVGSDLIDLIPAGAEATLGFGAIDGIRLERHVERNAEGDTGLITKSNTRVQNITFSVENLTAEPQQVRAFYPLTFSEQQDLKVKVTADPAPDESDIDRKRGVSAWDLALAPGEKREVHLKVELAWPDGMALNWTP